MKKSQELSVLVRTFLILTTFWVPLQPAAYGQLADPEQFQPLTFVNVSHESHVGLLPNSESIHFSTSWKEGDDTFSRRDTVRVDASKVNTSHLKSGTHQYLVYYKNGKDSSRVNFEFWSRTIDFTSHQGKEAISITQEWGDNKSIFHKANSICDKKTFATLYHESWWRGRGKSYFDFMGKVASVNDNILSDADTSRRSKRSYAAFKKALAVYNLNWHLDLEIFPTLPYKENVTFLINFYDPGFPAPSLQAYTVTGSATLEGYDNQRIDCWLLKHGSLPDNLEIFWISKQTKEVLKLEQEYNGKFRYKIKLSHSK